MPDRLDDEIRALVTELVEASPPPPPVSDVLGRPSRGWGSATTRSMVLRAAGVAVAVLAVGTVGVVLGRYVLPGSPSVALAEVVAGMPGPEPRFSTDELGDEVRLLQSSGTIEPELVGSALVGDVAAVGRIEGTDVEVFTWRTREHSLDGRCVQVVGANREGACSAPVAEHGAVPRTFAYTEASGAAIGVVVTGWVPEGTSVVSLELLERDDLRMWQRPSARVAAFVVEDPSVSVAFLTAWDADGGMLGRVGFSVQVPGELTPDPGGDYDRAHPLAESHPASRLIAGGATSMDAFSDAAHAQGLDFVCASGGQFPSWELCLVAADGVLAVVPFDSAQGLAAKISDPALTREVIVPLDTSIASGVRTIGPTAVDIEYYGARIGGMSAPWPAAQRLERAAAMASELARLREEAERLRLLRDDGAGGSGCEVPGDELPDGAWFGYALATDSETITFDLACFYGLEEAERQAAADGVEIANPYYIRNEDPRTFLVPVGPESIMYALFHGTDGNFELRSMALEAWPHPESPWPCPGGSCLVWLYVTDGVVTEAIEQYLP